MRFSASWHATQDDEGHLRTVGVMALGDGSVDYLGFPELEPESSRLQDLIKDALAAGCTPEQIFEYHTTDGNNGITVEWSEPFAVAAPSLDGALAQLIGNRQNLPRPL